MNAITLRKRFMHTCRRVLPEVNDLVVKCVQPCFSMYICAKQAQMETRSPLVHPGTPKAIGVDLLVPPIVYPPRYSPDGGSPVDICLGLCLVRS